MNTVTIQVLEGVDRGRVFRDLPVPFTVGREEGNLVRLNDERVSRFHAKIQQDDNDLILTDLESTNGTRVNGNVVQIRRLRLGDCIAVGRSLLLFGSNEEIAARMATLAGATRSGAAGYQQDVTQATVQAQGELGAAEEEDDFDFDVKDEVTVAKGELFVGNKPLPPLPRKLTPAQSARFAEILDFLHHCLTSATENVRANDDATEIKLTYADWQRVLAVQMLLSRYLRAIAEPDSIED